MSKRLPEHMTWLRELCKRDGNSPAYTHQIFRTCIYAGRRDHHLHLYGNCGMKPGDDYFIAVNTPDAIAPTGEGNNRLLVVALS